jgi:hypothetical protein
MGIIIIYGSYSQGEKEIVVCCLWFFSYYLMGFDLFWTSKVAFIFLF